MASRGRPTRKLNTKQLAVLRSAAKIVGDTRLSAFAKPNEVFVGRKSRLSSLLLKEVDRRSALV